MKKYLYLLIPSIALTVFIVFTILVKTIDVSYVNNYFYLGFSKMNLAANDYIVGLGYTNACDKISDVLLYVSFLFPLLYVLLGIVQWVKGKTLKAVDKELFVLAGLYVLIVIEYFVFELMKINMSPVKNSPSYPSSHVFIFITIIMSGLLLLRKYSLRSNAVQIASLIGGVLISIIMVFFRLGSGQHYLTDIIGGVLLAIFLVTAYYFTNRYVIERTNC